MKRKSGMVPVIKIVGVKNSGKTTLVEKLIQAFHHRGFKVAAMKHCNHDFELDQDGTDSHRLNRAGAVMTCVVNAGGFAIFGKTGDRPTVASYFQPLVPDADLIISEGNKEGMGPRIEINRRESREGPRCLDDPELIAMATDRDDLSVSVPVFHPDDVESMADFIEKKFLKKVS